MSLITFMVIICGIIFVFEKKFFVKENILFVHFLTLGVAKTFYKNLQAVVCSFKHGQMKVYI